MNYGLGVVTVTASGQNINGVTTSQTLAADSASAPTGLLVTFGKDYPWNWIGERLLGQQYGMLASTSRRPIHNRDVRKYRQRYHRVGKCAGNLLLHAIGLEMVMQMRSLALVLLLLTVPAMAQVFNCSSFSSSGTCGYSAFSGGSTNFRGNYGQLSGSVAMMEPVPNNHAGFSIWYQTAVNVQAFTTTYTFTTGGSYNGPNFVIQNENNNGSPWLYSGGAGAEAGFSQFAGGTNIYTNNVWALHFDELSSLSQSAGFTYSSAQIYQSLQAPFVPTGTGGLATYPTTKISTSPVPINSPPGTVGTVAGTATITAYSYSGGTLTLTASNSFTSGQSVTLWANSGDPLAVLSGTTYTVLSSGLSSSQFEITESTVTGSGSTSSSTGDLFSSTLSYDGWNVSVCLYDVTATNGSCSSSTSGTGTYFTHSWSGADIPSIVDGTTAYVGFTTGGSGGSIWPVDIKSWVYTVNTPTGTPSYTAWNANSQYNNGTPSSYSPVYSEAPGTYSSTQSVSIASTNGAGGSTGNYICYVLSSTTPTYYPQPDNNGGCVEGTFYSGPVSISSTTTLYAMAGTNNSSFSSGTTSPTGLGPPSTLVAGTYTINTGGPASTPIFSPVAGTYVGAQNVAISTSSFGAVICYTTNGATPATNGGTGCNTGTLYSSTVSVATSETLKAVAGGTGYSDSSVSSASYVVSSSAPAVIGGKTVINGKTVLQ